MIQDQRAPPESTSIDEIEARAAYPQAQPPQLNPASDEPISLTFSRNTPSDIPRPRQRSASTSCSIRR
jgi:hypothetical protein